MPAIRHLFLVINPSAPHTVHVKRGATTVAVGPESSCSPTSVANLARRFKSASYGSGLPDRFGTSSTYNNTRGLRMKIWTNP